MSDKRKNNTQDPNAYANALTKPRMSAGDVLAHGFGGAVKSVDAQEFERIAQNFNLNGQVIELAEGQAIEGTLEGPGPVLTVHQKNPETGMEEDKPLPTWQFDIGGGLKVAIWTSYQLDRELPPLVGQYICVVRMKQVNVKGGKRVTKFAIGALKNPNGTASE